MYITLTSPDSADSFACTSYEPILENLSTVACVTYKSDVKIFASASQSTMGIQPQRANIRHCQIRR